MDHGGRPDGGDGASEAVPRGSPASFLLECRGIEKSHGAPLTPKDTDRRVAAGEIDAFLEPPVTEKDIDSPAAQARLQRVHPPSADEY